MEDFKLIKIFFSKPGDVIEEIDEFKKVVGEINKFFSYFFNFKLELLMYGESTYSRAGKSAQDIVNDEIGDDYDIYVGVMWKTIGTRTDNEKSGTIEEYKKAYRRFDNNPNSVVISFYFRIALTKNLEELNKYKEVLEFKEQLSKQDKTVLYVEYKDIQEFRKLLNDGLYKAAKLVMDNKYNPSEIYKITPEKEYEKLFNILIDKVRSIQQDSKILNNYADEFTNRINEIKKKMSKVIPSPQNIKVFRKLLNEIGKAISEVAEKPKLIYRQYMEKVSDYLIDLNKIIFIVSKLKFEKRIELLQSYKILVNSFVESYKKELAKFEELLLNLNNLNEPISSIKSIKKKID